MRLNVSIHHGTVALRGCFFLIIACITTKCLLLLEIMIASSVACNDLLLAFIAMCVCINATMLLNENEVNCVFCAETPLRFGTKLLIFVPCVPVMT